MMQAQVSDIGSVAEFMLTNRVADARQMENILDDLLTFPQLPEARSLFIRLLEFYKSFDAAGAAFYWTEFERTFPPGED